DLVVGVEDREIRLEADELRMATKDPDADGVEGAQPLHAFDDAADKVADAVLHLARRLIGEGDGEDLSGPRLARVQQMGKPRRQHPGLAGAGARQHQERSLGGLHRLALFGVQPGEVTRIRPRGGARGDAAGGHRGALVVELVEPEWIGWAHRVLYRRFRGRMLPRAGAACRPHGASGPPRAFGNRRHLPGRGKLMQFVSLETRVLKPSGAIPNSRLPLVIYRSVALPELRTAEGCARLFSGNGWGGNWIDGVFDYWHFHTTGHEVLGCVAGQAVIGFGGADGIATTVTAG